MFAPLACTSVLWMPGAMNEVLVKAGTLNVSCVPRGQLQPAIDFPPLTPDCTVFTPTSRARRTMLKISRMRSEETCPQNQSR